MQVGSIIGIVILWKVVLNEMSGILFDIEQISSIDFDLKNLRPLIMDVLSGKTEVSLGFTSVYIFSDVTMLTCLSSFSISAINNEEVRTAIYAYPVCCEFELMYFIFELLNSTNHTLSQLFWVSHVNFVFSN